MACPVEEALTGNHTVVGTDRREVAPAGSTTSTAVRATWYVPIANGVTAATGEVVAEPEPVGDEAVDAAEPEG